MRSLAEFIMRGRTQAVAVAVLGTGSVFFAWIGAAAIALVTLRKGLDQGLYLLVWAMLPAAVIAVQGADLGPMSAILGVYLGAVALRMTASWPMALVAISACGVLLAVTMNTVAVQQSQMIADMLGQMMEQLRSSNPQAVVPQLGATDVAGLIGSVNAYLITLGLVLGRWWQAVLFNPGGFRTEFHAIRLPQLLVMLLVVAALLLGSRPGLQNWMLIPLMPLTVAGLGLVHALSGRYGLSGNWLFVFYVLWVFLMPMRWLVQLLAVVDSFIDVRRRLPARNNKSDG